MEVLLEFMDIQALATAPKSRISPANGKERNHNEPCCSELFKHDQEPQDAMLSRALGDWELGIRRQAQSPKMVLSWSLMSCRTA